MVGPSPGSRSQTTDSPEMVWFTDSLFAQTLGGGTIPRQSPPIVQVGRTLGKCNDTLALTLRYRWDFSSWYPSNPRSRKTPFAWVGIVPISSGTPEPHRPSGGEASVPPPDHHLCNLRTDRSLSVPSPPSRHRPPPPPVRLCISLRGPLPALLVPPPNSNHWSSSAQHGTWP